MRIKAIDFFCGAGGLTRGFLNAGIEVICGIDSDVTARKTYEENNKIYSEPVPFLPENLLELEPNILSKYVPKERSNRDHKLVFAACPPCQIFSKVNTDKTRRENDKDLLLRFGEFVKEYLPDYVFVENVPGIRKEKYGNILQRFSDILAYLGYGFDAQIINAKYYGIPQNRTRMIALAAMGTEIHFPPNTHSRDNFETVKSAITKYPPIKAGDTHPSVPNHQAARLSHKNLTRISVTPKDGGNRLVWADRDDLKLKCYSDHSGHTDVYGRMRWKEVAPALTTRFNSLSNGRFGHPEQDRAISLREGAALQTFGDDYIFCGKAIHVARHIGNAFPVELGRLFGKWLIKHAMNSI